MNNEIKKLVDNVEKVIVGKTDVIVNVVVALISGGHILIEDVPGVGTYSYRGCSRRGKNSACFCACKIA